MPFEKGRVKTGGRQAGTPNKFTKEIRDILKSVYEQELENIPKYLKDLSSKERLDFLLKITPYVLPQVNKIDMDEGEPFAVWE